ncbi:MAG: hypothetical protein P4M08_04540 [Oligoflexia bacterium]|nr:hypothetical protein [Oligoflexia bacterium]
MTNKKILLPSIAITTFLFILSVNGAVAAEAHPVYTLGEHGGKILQSESRSAEVSIDPSGRSAKVYLQPSDAVNPPSVQLTLIDKDDQATTFELKAISMSDLAIPVYMGAIPTAPTSIGTFSPENQSFVGFELQIPLPAQKIELFR